MSWRDDLNYGLAAFGVQIPASLPLSGVGAAIASEQTRNAALVAAAGAILFLHFEKRHNPAVNDIGDATLYASACLSAGHAAIQPVTKAGKLLGSLLLTCGPSLARADNPGDASIGSTQEDLHATLKSILTAMESRSGTEKSSA